ncbi:protein FERTILITY RESTORER RF2, mitochondrial [Oryza brachyantha]|nr:protein FERTILITY RESTORER RF2, mitochondrial [Oryza brachyantha]
MSSYAISLPGAVTNHAPARRFGGSQFQTSQAVCISFKREVSAKAVLRQSIRCNATQTQSAQRKSSTATVKRSDPKGKTQAPKLDDGSGGFPPFRFGKGGGGGGGGGGGSNYFGGFLLFTCVLLLDYLKEFERNLSARRQRAGDDASNEMLQQ